MGDHPCKDCGTDKNIVWFTDDVLWNEVMTEARGGGTIGAILCVRCFVIRAEKKLHIKSWRLIPNYTMKKK